MDISIREATAADMPAIPALEAAGFKLLSSGTRCGEEQHIMDKD